MELSGEIYFAWVGAWVGGCVRAHVFMCACLCVEWNNFLLRDNILLLNK